MDKREINSFEGGEKKGKKKMIITSAIMVTFLALLNPGCKKADDLVTHDENTMPATEGMRNSYSVFYSVSDIADYHPVNIDRALINAWGLAFGPNGGTWVTAAGSGRVMNYSETGNILQRPVTVPAADGTPDGSPVGVVYNRDYGHGFIIPSTGESSKFIFATEDGTIAAWASGTSAVTVVNRSSHGCVYKGLALGTYNGSYRLYATDFHNGKIDVYDEAFHLINSGEFYDPRAMTGYAPFGIRAFGDKLVVTYALQDEEGEDDVSGMGNGYVDIYKTNGAFVRRFAADGMLNSPYGIESFVGTPRTGALSDEIELNSDRRTLLIGNFGDGHINMYDGNGRYLGQLTNNGEAITIDGLWSISYKRTMDATARDGKLFFTAGPRDETHGLFGYILPSN
jgi:uncharacterized protein (TIGR03118 family)